MNFDYNTLPEINIDIIKNPLPVDIADSILLNGTCHVDHEGFDLNEIEQAYYKHNGIQLTKDSTWYKDGGQQSGTNAMLYTWFTQNISDKLILDHSHFVFKYPILGEAREQILSYTNRRPELYRILSAGFKCGLDLCIDYHNGDRIEPIVHIEWDYDSIDDLVDGSKYVEIIINANNWIQCIPSILRYNELARINKIDAFSQADTRSMIVFGQQSYKLIPTI